MPLRSLVCWCSPRWVLSNLLQHHLGVGALCFHCLPIRLIPEDILLIQAQRNSPRQATAPTGGPSSVAAEPPLPEKADRQSERQVGRQANRQRVRRSEEPESGACTLQSGLSAYPGRHVSSVGASRDTQSLMLVAPAGTSRCFLVLFFHLSCNYFPSGPAVGKGCQVVLWEGVMGTWRDRVSQ